MNNITTDELIGFLNDITTDTVWVGDYDCVYTTTTTSISEEVFRSIVGPLVDHIHFEKVPLIGESLVEVYPQSAPQTDEDAL